MSRDRRSRRRYKLFVIWPGLTEPHIIWRCAGSFLMAQITSPDVRGLDLGVSDIEDELSLDRLATTGTMHRAARQDGELPNQSNPSQLGKPRM